MQIKPRSGQDIRNALSEQFTRAGLSNPLNLIRRKPSRDIDSMTKRIILPSLPVTDEEMARATHQDKGQKLARQEMWEELAGLIQYADDCRLATPGGESASTLLALGARSDVVSAAADALFDGEEPNPGGIEALEEMHAEHYGNYACALVVALSHIDIGWAWRNTSADSNQPEHELRFRTHLKRAGDLLAPYDCQDLDSPSLAAAQCALVALDAKPAKRIADEYETLINLDPDSPRHMRSMGQCLLPNQYGSYEQLELEARRTASRTGDIWGAGAYAWVYLDALSIDPYALAMLDHEFFIEGMKDIIHRKPDQHIINLFTAFCAIAMARRTGKNRLPAPVEAAQAKLHDCLDWLLENHLQELHPLIWSQTLLTPGALAPLPSRRALVVKGRQAALRVIAERFADDIEDGSTIAFSTSGMYRLPAL